MLLRLLYLERERLYFLRLQIKGCEFIRRPEDDLGGAQFRRVEVQGRFLYFSEVLGFVGFMSEVSFQVAD